LIDSKINNDDVLSQHLTKCSESLITEINMAK